MYQDLETADPNVLQIHKAGCAIKCQQLILWDYGIDVDEKQLIEIAYKNGWFDQSQGTFMRYNGRLLGCFGIAYHHTQNSTITQIILELKCHHRVMVNVNKSKLAGIETPYPDASHSVIVNDVTDDWVYITDTALGCVGKKYSILGFMRAWEDSLNYMLATSEPAEYEYNALMRKMQKLNLNY